MLFLGLAEGGVLADCRRHVMLDPASAQGARRGLMGHNTEHVVKRPWPEFIAFRGRGGGVGAHRGLGGLVWVERHGLGVRVGE